jgi:Ca2+-binding EF-hand superfamily protein
MKIRAVFRICDADGDGIVTQADLLSCMQYSCLANSIQLDASTLHDVCTDLFDELDVNHDNKLTVEDFERGLSSGAQRLCVEGHNDKARATIPARRMSVYVHSC